VLGFIAIVGVFTNIGMIGYTSTALSAALPLSLGGIFEINESNKALYLVGLEHLVFTMQICVLFLLPDCPEQLALQRARINWRKKAIVEHAKSEPGKSIMVDGNLNVRPAPVQWDDEAIPERFWKEKGWDSSFHEPRRGNELIKMIKAGEHKVAEEQKLKDSELVARRLEQAKLEQTSIRRHKLEMASRRSPVKIKVGGCEGSELGGSSSRLYAVPYEPSEIGGSQAQRQRLLGQRPVMSDDLRA
jgi:hypothetical protein